MRKTLAIMFGISVVASVGYLVWAYGGAGKKILTNWLLKTWKQRADKLKKALDVKKLEAELNKLEYEDIELLFRFTFKMTRAKEGSLDYKTEESLRKIMDKVFARKIAKRADLTQLNNISLFGT